MVQEVVSPLFFLFDFYEMLVKASENKRGLYGSFKV